MIWAAFTPWASERIQHSTFGFIPALTIPLSINSLASDKRIFSIKEEGSFSFLKIPGVSVRRINFSAPSAAASSPETVSAFILCDLPSEELATLEMTGM